MIRKSTTKLIAIHVVVLFLASTKLKAQQKAKMPEVDAKVAQADYIFEGNVISTKTFKVKKNDTTFYFNSQLVEITNPIRGGVTKGTIEMLSIPHNGALYEVGQERISVNKSGHSSHTPKPTIFFSKNVTEKSDSPQAENANNKTLKSIASFSYENEEVVMYLKEQYNFNLITKVPEKKNNK
jgi:hypothetical protein